jgi:hypothetical protein
MDRFSETLKDARLLNDFRDGIRGAGAFASELTCFPTCNRSRQRR